MLVLRNENSISRLLFNLKRSSDLGFAKSFTQVRFPNELQNKLSACRRCGIASFNVLQINRRLENPVGKTWRRVVCRTFKSESFYKYFYKWELHKTSALDVFELQNKFYAACRNSWNFMPRFFAGLMCYKLTFFVPYTSFIIIAMKKLSLLS